MFYWEPKVLKVAQVLGIYKIEGSILVELVVSLLLLLLLMMVISYPSDIDHCPFPYLPNYKVKNSAGSTQVRCLRPNQKTKQDWWVCAHPACSGTLPVVQGAVRGQWTEGSESSQLLELCSHQNFSSFNSIHKRLRFTSLPYHIE